MSMISCDGVITHFVSVIGSTFPRIKFQKLSIMGIRKFREL